MHLLLFAAAALCTSACATTSGGAGGSSSSRGSRGGASQDVVTIGSFAVVQAIGVSRQYVFAGTESGIAIYDRNFQRWLPPLTGTSGYGDDQITVMVADPVEDALWYGVPGGIVVYRPNTEQMQRSMVTGIPDFIAFDRSGTGDAWVRASGQWTRVSRGGMAVPASQAPSSSQLIIPATLADVYRRFPTLRGQLPFLMRSRLADRAMIAAQPISGTITPDRVTEAWLGTNGEGIWRVDATFMQGDAFRFGPMERGTGAIAPAADGIWIAGLGRSQLHGGISYGSNDMQHWEWIEGTIAVPMRGTAARALAVRQNRAWVGTENGLYRFRLDGIRDVISWTSLDGLPADRVYAVAPRTDGAWVGTERGIAWVSDTAQFRDAATRGIERVLLANMPVRALLAQGDTLWLGTDAGLMALDTKTDALLRPRSDLPELSHPVRSIALSDSVLLVATDESLVSLSPRGTREPVRLNMDVQSVGQVTRIAIDNNTIVVAGISSVLVTQRDGSAERRLQVGRELPAPVLDVVLHDEWIWLATADGLVRIRRASDGRIAR